MPSPKLKCALPPSSLIWQQGRDDMSGPINRRHVIAGGCSALPLISAARVLAAVKAETAVPPSVVTQPPRQWGKVAPPDVFPDPDVLPIDDSFNRPVVRYSPIRRL